MKRRLFIGNLPPNVTAITREGRGRDREYLQSISREGDRDMSTKKTGLIFAVAFDLSI